MPSTEDTGQSPELLKAAGLRPTRQRRLLTWLLFRWGERHISAEQLFEEATALNVPISLATVYNTLNGLTAAGLLREVAIEGSKTLFDTRTSDHWHFYNEDDGTLSDVNAPNVAVHNIPTPPAGTKISRVDVLARICKPAERV